MEHGTCAEFQEDAKKQYQSSPGPQIGWSSKTSFFLDDPKRIQKDCDLTFLFFFPRHLPVFLVTFELLRVCSRSTVAQAIWLLFFHRQHIVWDMSFSDTKIINKFINNLTTKNNTYQPVYINKYQHILSITTTSKFINLSTCLIKEYQGYVNKLTNIFKFLFP